MHPEAPPFYLTAALIEEYCQRKLQEGVAASAVAKYRDALNHLRMWLGSGEALDLSRLQAWRQHLETSGYSRHTIQKYTAQVNSYLRYWGREDLHIPRPIRNDLTGRTFGYLTAAAPVNRRHRSYIVWRCVCRCGREIEVPSGMLLGGNTTSCGCLIKEIFQHHNRYEEGTELRQALEEKVLNPNSASGYVGVQPKGDKWTAYITYKKKHYYLGTFHSIEDAVKARARAKEAVMEDAARIYAQTDHLYGQAPGRPQPPEKISFVPPAPSAGPARRSDNTSGCPGVTRSKGKWAASIAVNQIRYRLGAYDRQEDAIAARKHAEQLVKAGDLEALRAICTNRKK